MQSNQDDILQGFKDAAQKDDNSFEWTNGTSYNPSGVMTYEQVELQRNHINTRVGKWEADQKRVKKSEANEYPVANWNLIGKRLGIGLVGGGALYVAISAFISGVTKVVAIISASPVISIVVAFFVFMAFVSMFSGSGDTGCNDTEKSRGGGNITVINNTYINTGSK